MFCFRFILPSLLVMACAGEQLRAGSDLTNKRELEPLSTSYCGSTSIDATKCETACTPGVYSYDCPFGEECFEGITCQAPTESSFPSEAPTLIGSEAVTSSRIKFNGFLQAYSLDKGMIDLAWTPPIVENFFSSPEDVTYDIFVALGKYTFDPDQDIPELISVFETNVDYQHIEISGDIQDISLSNTNYGELHTLMITAKVSGEYSKITRGTEVIVSRVDPQYKEGVDVIGVFVPTPSINIFLSDAQFGEEHFLTFSGSEVTDEAKLLTTGDVFTGFTTELDYFIRMVTESVAVEDDLVVLKVVEPSLEDIFEELDLSGVFSDPEEAETGLSRRKLFFGDIANAVTKGFTWLGQRALTTIGGPVLLITDWVLDEFGVEFGGDFNVNLLSFEEEWESEPFTYVTATGYTGFNTNLNVGIRIGGASVDFLSLGLEANYVSQSTLEFAAETSAEIESTEYELWRGRKGRRWITALKVPILVEWQPKLDLKMEAGAEISGSAQVGVGVEGETSVFVVYDKDNNPKLYGEANPPSLDLTYCNEIAAGANIVARSAVAFSLEVDVKRGLLSTIASVEAGLGIETGVNIDQGLYFELFSDFSIPIEADALFGAVGIIDEVLYENRWPLISLESGGLNFLDQFQCGCDEFCLLPFGEIDENPTDPSPITSPSPPTPRPTPITSPSPPTPRPTPIPTNVPSVQPSTVPSTVPSVKPSAVPSTVPTKCKSTKSFKCSKQY